MNVQVVDLKTGKLKTMQVKYANILVKMNRARWPDAVGAELSQPIPEAETAVQVGLVYPGVLSVPNEGTYLLEKSERVIAPDAEAEAPKKRGRKPKVQE